MPILEWTEKLSVGIAAVDEEHKRLLGMVNELYDAMQAGRAKEVLGSVLDGLITYTKTHFAHEERLMRDYDFPGLVAHQVEHHALTQRVIEVHREFMDGPSVTLSVDVMRFLWKWLANHIMVTDKAYADFLNAKGVH